MLRPASRAQAYSTHCAPSSLRSPMARTRTTVVFCTSPRPSLTWARAGVAHSHIGDRHELRQQFGGDHSRSLRTRWVPVQTLGSAAACPLFEAGSGVQGTCDGIDSVEYSHWRDDPRELNYWERSLCRRVSVSSSSRIGWNPFAAHGSGYTAGEPDRAGDLDRPATGVTRSTATRRAMGQVSPMRRCTTRRPGPGRFWSSAAPPPTTKARSATSRRPRRSKT